MALSFVLPFPGSFPSNRCRETVRYKVVPTAITNAKRRRTSVLKDNKRNLWLAVIKGSMGDERLSMTTYHLLHGFDGILDRTSSSVQPTVQKPHMKSSSIDSLEHFRYDNSPPVQLRDVKHEGPG